MVISAFLSLSAQTKKKAIKDLPETYRRWLEEEVVYIISPKEKEIFLQLETDRERDLFIEGFWKQRDPNPSTPENEFKKEHYRRIEYANKFFGRESPGPGWRSDMGRIYIILGEPKTVEKFENLTECYPVIVWFYEGMAEYGLPNSFYIVFFKEGGSGDYKLYSPLKYGPQQLLVHYWGDQSDYEGAYRQLYAVNPLLAEVSLSLIPGEAQTLTPSISSEILIASRIPSMPHERIKDTWAEKLLAYKDIIEVEYSTNYVESESLVNVIQDKSGIFFVHYLIEPKRLTIEEVGGEYYSRLEVNGTVTDAQGRMIYQFERAVPIELTAERLASIKAKLFSFQDVFPIIAGNYKLRILLKNSVSKEFTSLETEIETPPTNSPYISPLILAHRLDRDSKYKGSTKPFLFNNLQLLPSPRNDFITKDRLYVFFQLLNLTGEQRERWWVEYSIFKEKEKVFSSLKETRIYPDLPDVLEEYSLEGLAPAHYRIKVSLLDERKQEVFSRENNFYISPSIYLPRPWVVSFPFPSSNDPMFDNIIGNQFLNKKDFAQARGHLEKAYRQNPSVAKYALDYAYFLLAQKEYKEAKRIALPFLNQPERNEFLSLLGRTCQALAEYEEAISYYKEYLGHFGTNVPILNALGECYYRLGKKEEALQIWEKSLEINPQQEELKKLVSSIKNKR